MVIWLNWLSPSEGGLVSLRGSKNENLGDKNLYSLLKYYSFPGGSEDKESAFSTGDPGLIPRLGRSPAEGNGNPLQYSHLENSMDRGAWQATVHGVAKSDITKQLSLSPYKSLQFCFVSITILITWCLCSDLDILKYCAHILENWITNVTILVGFPWNSPGKNTGVGAKHAC